VQIKRTMPQEHGLCDLLCGYLIPATGHRVLQQIQVRCPSGAGQQATGDVR
jgi:hypothetical protein